MTALPPQAKHDEFDALAVGWALDAWEPDDRAALGRHRSDGCRLCEEQITATQEVAAELAYALAQPDPPPELRGRVMAAASRVTSPPCG